MKRDPNNSNEWRRSFTTALLAVVALCSLFIGSYNDNADLVVKIGLLVITLSSMLLMVFLLIGNLKSLGFKNENKFTGKTDITVSSFEAEHKTIESVTGFLPDRDRLEERSAEEKILTTELKEILKAGFTLPNCRKGLELLDRHKAIVERSWTHLLNKARLLRMAGRAAEAERLTLDVIRRFSESREAVGTAYEVLSFIEEFREPKVKGAPYKHWLKKRRDYVIEGLKFFPTGHDLLMNAFEVATLQGSAAEALDYLNRAALVNRERTQENLKVNPLTHKARGLSPEVKRAINELLEGDYKMNTFEMVKAKTLILVLAITATLGLSAGTSSYNNRGLPQDSAPARHAAPAPPDEAESSDCSSTGEGTSIGATTISLVREGTSIGNS